MSLRRAQRGSECEASSFGYEHTDCGPARLGMLDLDDQYGSNLALAAHDISNRLFFHLSRRLALANLADKRRGGQWSSDVFGKGRNQAEHETVRAERSALCRFPAHSGGGLASRDLTPT